MSSTRESDFAATVTVLVFSNSANFTSLPVKPSKSVSLAVPDAVLKYIVSEALLTLSLLIVNVIFSPSSFPSPITPTSKFSAVALFAVTLVTVLNNFVLVTVCL